MMSTGPANPYAYQSEQPPEYDETQRKRSKWASCFMGCMIALGIMIVLAIIAGFIVSRYWRGWFANVGLEAINQGIDASDLPPQEKVEIKAQAERVTKAFGRGEISMDQVMAIAEKLTKSPLMPSFIVMAVDKQYFDKSGLSAEEKAEGRKELRRFARGAIDGKIDQQGVDAVLSHVADRQGENNWHFRQNVTDADLKAAIAEAKSRADKAGVSAEAEPNIDPSDEVKRIIDEALQEKK
jgi:hypothetical protein